MALRYSGGVSPLRSLSSAFAKGAGTPEIDLEAALAHACARAETAWPSVALERATFAEFLGKRIRASELESARVEDLWIACACLEHSPSALGIVETKYWPEVDLSLVKMGLRGDRIEDLKQSLRRLLFVGDTESAPRIGEYRGAGDLRAWMRITAMRAALKLLRKDRREALSSDDALLEARAQEDDPELAYMKASYRSAFKSAFQEALDSLNERERMLLKQQIVDGLNVDEIGVVYDVHRATAARWVASAREKLLVRTRRTFMLRARISSEECESVMRLVRSQLDISLHRRLASGA
jgi:RNA polymerase sigma-70 factor (ECF subfamily)